MRSFLVLFVIVLACLADTAHSGSGYEVSIPGFMSSQSGVTKPEKGSQPEKIPKAEKILHTKALKPKELSALQQRVQDATPRIRELMRAIGHTASKHLERTCGGLPKGQIPDFNTVLGGYGKRGTLENLMPRRSNIFAHRFLNRGSCSSVGGSCISNGTLPRHPDEFLNRFAWDRCAVVGNSGSLLVTRYGAAIDKHDIVIRMNIAPTSGKEEYVGSKTTLRLINSKWARLYASGSSMVGVGKGTDLIVRVVDNASFYMSLVRTLNRKKSKTNVLLLNTNTVKAAQKLLDSYRVCMYFNGRRFAGGTVPSSGFVLSLALSQICNRVNLYGFGRPRFNNKLVPYQYYVERNNDGTVNQGSENHSFAMELIVLQEMSRSKKPKFNYCSITESGTRICRNLDTDKGKGKGAADKSKPAVSKEKPAKSKESKDASDE